MPFTPCHAAAAAPLRRLGLPLSALVVGSMSPDFLYYLAFVKKTIFGHTPVGLVLFCLPASLVVLAVFHEFLKWPLLSLLPTWLQERLEPAAERPFAWRGVRRVALIVCAVMIGAVSHVAWDAFTHGSGWGVQLLPFLTRELRMGPVHAHLYDFLQDLSTLGGALLLFAWSRRWLLQAPARPVSARVQRSHRNKVAWLVCLTVPSVVVGFVASIGMLYEDHDPIRRFIISGLIATITALIALTMAFALYYHLRARERVGAN